MRVSRYFFKSMKAKAKTKTRKKRVSMDDLISQAEAAKLRGVSRASISDLVKRGRLSTREVAGRPLLIRREVESFEAWPEGRGKKAPSKRR